MMPNKAALPFGAITLVLVGMTLAYSWLSRDHCDTLESKMEQGFFLRWMPPQLLLVTSTKQTLIVEAESKSAACEIMLKKIQSAEE